MKRIVFINPPNTPITSSTISIEPIDILQIATYTQTLGHAVTFLDLDYKYDEQREDVLRQHIEKHKPDIAICLFDYHIPLHHETTQNHIVTIATLCAGYQCETRVGGKMATYMPQTFIYPGSPIILAIRYDLEGPLQQLLNTHLTDNETREHIPNIAYLKDNTLYCTAFGKQPVDITQLPIPDRNLVDLNKHIDVRTMLTSRGCMMKCSFCHVPGFWGKRQGRTPTQIVDEIAYLIDTTGTKKILFLDDNATVDTKRMEAIASEIIHRGIQVSWGCLSTIHSYSPTLMSTMYKAGCRRIHYGIESADSTISKNIHKHLNEKLIIKAVLGTKAIGIRVRTSRIMDLPGTTEEGLQKTLSLMEQLQSDEIRVHFLVQRLGSELYDSNNTTITSQYIHNSYPTQQQATLSPDCIMVLVQGRLDRMQEQGYTLIDTVEKNNLCASGYNARGRYISLCPLRYGINR